jgi:hypothetical protein
MIPLPLVVSFVAGLTAGRSLARHSDAVDAAVRPVAVRVRRRLGVALERAEKGAWERRERLEDLVAALREALARQPAAAAPPEVAP